MFTCERGRAERSCGALGNGDSTVEVTGPLKPATGRRARGERLRQGQAVTVAAGAGKKPRPRRPFRRLNKTGEAIQSSSRDVDARSRRIPSTTIAAREQPKLSP